MPRVRPRTVLAASTAVTLFAVLATAAPAFAATAWTTAGYDHADALTRSQGLATIVRPGGTQLRYTGVGTIPLSVRVEGWDHVGDPDSVAGYYVEPYEHAGATAKMYRAQAPDGSWREYVHALGADEAYNNSFDAISPGGAWMLSGEWNTMTRLLGFATPGLNPAAVPGADLPTAFTVQLDHPVRDVQGCTFFSAQTLLCASDDAATDLFGMVKPLLRVDLARPLDGADVTGHVTALRPLPLSSLCPGSFEVEGVDYDRADGTLRVIVMSPGICVVIDSKSWRLRQA
jgi:hypothetical protein